MKPSIWKQHNETQHNGIQNKKTQHNDTQYNDTQYNETQHNETQRNETQHKIYNNKKMQHRIMTLDADAVRHYTGYHLCNLSQISQYAECHYVECHGVTWLME